VRQGVLERRPYRAIDYLLAIEDTARIGAIRLRPSGGTDFLGGGTRSASRFKRSNGESSTTPLAPARSGGLRRIAGAMSSRAAPANSDVPLTPRETQVIRLIAMGLSNKEIGDSLEISIETVKEHVQNLLRKIALEDRTQAAVWAIRHGFD
jgi:DNA-binding CsgD family transcriptional regulator